MKNRCMAFAAIFFVCAAGIPAQEEGGNPIDSDELRKNLAPVEFINNTARPTVINTRSEIMTIGSRLGLAVRNNTGEAGGRVSYFVRHNIYPPELGKLDADIFGLGPQAGVDTIRNLRMIIQGYLEAAYSYSAGDAALLAEFITIYNAVYRKNRAYFSGRYKTPLMETLVPEGSEGLSTLWSDWPGQTLMLIPLRTAADGSLSAVDTTTITSGDVIDRMREDDDRGIEQRQAMVDLKEREADEASQKAELQREAIVAEEQRIAAERRRIEEERAALEKQRAAEADAQKAAGVQKDSDADEAALSEEEAAKKEAELAAREEELEKSEQALEELRKEEEANLALAERKSEEAQAERRGISEDQAEVLGIAAPPTQAAAPSLLGVRLNPGAASVGRIVRINATNAAQIQSSELNTLNARTVTFAAGKIIATANSGGKQFLVEIDGTTLQVVKQGQDELNKDSLIWLNGVSLYAISVNGGKNYLSRFNTDLVKQAGSNAEIHPQATVIFQGDKLLTQNPSGAVIILNPESLAE
ncbi:MAG: hypothetical protein LBD20_06420 [Spirochaetaceae bacterium]|jgi:hypothetical protein|nr:hypothetical protein [Spirochaetaceae bacterium]